MLKIILLIIFILIFVYFLLGFVVSYIGYTKKFKRTKKNNDHNTIENTTFSESSPWFKHYDRLVENVNYYKSLNLEEITIKSDDGLTLHGSFFPSNKQSNKYILSIHGFGGDRFHNNAISFSALLHRDYNIIFIDLRGHGKSQGNHITFGVKDCLDLVRWEEYIHNRFGNDINLFIHGVSMGAATVLMAADKLNNVQAIVADCGFTSNYLICQDISTKTAGFFGKSTMPLLRLIVKINAKYDMKKENTLISLKNTQIPILFIHGKKDNYVPVKMSEDNYNICSSKKDIRIFENAEHALSYLENEQEYSKIMYDWYERNKK